MIIYVVSLAAVLFKQLFAKITQGLSVLSSSSYGFLGSFFLGLLLSPLTEIIKKRFIHATFSDIEIQTIRQGGFFITRLSVKNKGRAAAREVRAHLESILDDGKIREGFVPCPMWWTHGQVEKVKGLSPHEPAQLDVLKLTQNQSGNCEFRFQISAGLAHDPFSRVYANKETKGVIGIYELGGSTEKIGIVVNWDGSFSKPNARFRKVS